MSTWDRTAGYPGPDIVATLDGVDSLAAATAIEAVVWRRDTTETLPASITDAAAREVTVDVSAWLPTAEAGPWSLRFLPTIADEQVPWPEGEPDTVTVWSP